MKVELPFGAFLAAFLVLVPLPWHWRSGSVPTIAMSLWLFAANLILGINSIIWADTVRIMHVVWCDINTRIQTGSNIALAATILCICMQLERVSSVRQVGSTRGEKRRRQIIDSLICFGLPVIYMAMHYIVQGHRFDIIENYGCRPYIHTSLASIFIIWVPPLVISLASMVLSAMAFRHFWIRRITFSRHLADSNSAITTNRYFRLMCMTLIQMFLGTIVTTYNMVFTYRDGVRPWVSWADVHYNFSRISLYPEILIPKKLRVMLSVAWWVIPVSGYVFFAFFGFGEDALKSYKACFGWIRRTIFRIPDKPTTASKGFSSFPSARHMHLATISTSSQVLRDPKYDGHDALPSPRLPAYTSTDTMPAPYIGPFSTPERHFDPTPSYVESDADHDDHKSTSKDVTDDESDDPLPTELPSEHLDRDPESLVRAGAPRAL